MRSAAPSGLQDAILRLRELLGVDERDAPASFDVSVDGWAIDALVECRGLRFALEWKSSGSLGHVFRAVHQLLQLQDLLPESTIPVLAVPFMGRSARLHCEGRGVAWLDLSGNARIRAPGVYVHTDGHANRFPRRGQPETAFGQKGSRVARWLLMHPGRSVRQQALAEEIDLDRGHVSRVIGKLVELGLVERGKSGVRVSAPARLLEAWRDEYRFDRHTVRRGHVSASGDENPASVLARACSLLELPYAATALAGAWCWTGFARYRLTTVYLASPPRGDLLEQVGFRDEPRGANTWLVVPNDQSVFDGAKTVGGIRCVHPIQIYLDLKDHPERSQEAAEELLRQWDWNADGRQTNDD